MLCCLGCQHAGTKAKTSLSSYQIEAGFNLSVIAAEPLLEAPVALDFDLQGRMWVAEMRGYMLNLDGEGEQLPLGRITILEDLDSNGIMDRASVFLDSLVLPRALTLVYDGLLYAEPPNLWFVEIHDDRPAHKILIDSAYADGGNVEHQPNGLMMNIDNWIYSANSHKRYQRKNGVWKKEPTSFRGQWGITKDEIGRLYYNNNSDLLQGDFVLPDNMIRNTYYSPQYAIGRSLTKNQRVYPLHATAINRGYEPGVLDQNDRLVNTTSACGPLIYLGGQFPESYHSNAFICVPEANLIKRLILSFDQIQTSAVQAWDTKEFVASIDEAFRPVSLYQGPDGAMYIVDMHRGIIQHSAYLTPYLRSLLQKKGLDKIKGMGRILKVHGEVRPVVKMPDLIHWTQAEWIQGLRHENSWVRDKAQQWLVLHGEESDVPDLERIARQIENPIAQIHALHTLHGMDKLRFALVYEVAQKSEVAVVQHALDLLDCPTNIGKIDSLEILARTLMLLKQPETDLYLLSALGKWAHCAERPFLPLFMKLAETQTDTILLEVVVSSAAGFENKIRKSTSNKSLQALLDLAIENRKLHRQSWIYETESVEEDDRTRGLRLFKTICSACHGPGGAGLTGIAPPLRDSEYLSGPGKTLALIVLHGLKGPVQVNGKTYTFNSEMPGIASNPNLSDQDIADLIIYLSNAFGTSAREVTADMIKDLRRILPASGGAFTEAELLQLEQ